jgi:superfamily II DNA helicase RecQ
LALTATARTAMCEEIKNSLGLTDTVIIKTSFDRNNIFFGIEEIATSKQEKSYKNRGKTLKRIVDAKIPKHIIIKSWIDSYPNEKIIVYVNSRSECDELSIKLNEICPNVSKSYNAGLSKEKRETIQKEFSTGIFNVIICTIAFGMGIDQIVRGVLIFGYPSSIEEYYQQIGRAGRDNKPSFSIFYYDYCQMMKNKSGLKDEKKIEQIDALTKLIYSPFCKRKYILEYFEEKCDFTNCNNCSNCCNFINCENNLIDVTSIFSDIILKNSIKTATIKVKPYLTRDGNKILFFSHFKEWKELYSKLDKPTKKDKAKLKLIYNNKYISIPIEEPVDLDDLDNLEKKYKHLLN